MPETSFSIPSKTVPDGADYICWRCAGLYPTCCTLDGADEVCFPLSKAEALRIEACAPIPGYAGSGAFSRIIANSPLFMESMHRLFPREERQVNILFPMGESHLSLALNKEKGCFFLGATGCLLPDQARPRFCLLFPFWVMDGALNLFNNHNCLAMKEHRRLSSLMRLFGVDRAEIRRRYALLRLDWGFP